MLFILHEKHPSYNEDNLQNDIAILKLPKAVTLSKTIQVACLPPNSLSTYPAINSTAWIVGNSKNNKTSFQSIKFQVNRGHQF